MEILFLFEFFQHIDQNNSLFMSNLQTYKIWFGNTCILASLKKLPLILLHSYDIWFQMKVWDNLITSHMKLFLNFLTLKWKFICAACGVSKCVFVFILRNSVNDGMTYVIHIMTSVQTFDITEFVVFEPRQIYCYNNEPLLYDLFCLKVLCISMITSINVSTQLLWIMNIKRP